MKRYIGHPRVEGTASRQAHADLPPGTYEREMSKEGFFGPAAFFHHRHPPTGWSSFEGPLSPHAFDFTKLDAVSAHPWAAADLLHNASVRIRFWRTSGKMDALARNADGDELLFVHQGRGDLYCDFGRLAFEAGDYVVLPRGTMWRLECAEPAALLMIEATNASYMLPEKGLVGGHAIFDPAMLDAPRVDEAFLAQQDEKPWRVAVKRRGAVSTVTFPYNPLDAIGWHGDLSACRINVRDIRPLMSHRYHLPPSAHTTFVGNRFVVCTFVPRPFETDPGAIKIPFFHNNDDYDEVIFYHAGDFFSRDNIHPGMVTLHPGGFTHGPHPKALSRMLVQPKPATDEYAVMVDTRDALEIGAAAAKVEWEGYVDSWKGGKMKLASLKPAAATAGSRSSAATSRAPCSRPASRRRCRRRSTTGRRRSPRWKRSRSRSKPGARAAFPSTQADAASPLPRAHHWVDGSAYVNHVELVRKARGAKMPESFWTDPLVYQGGSDDFLPPTADAPFGSEDWGIDLEGEVAVITDDVPMGTTPAAARGHIQLVMLVNDWSLRNLIPAELEKGFGFYQSKPATAFSPVAVTPDELGQAWRDARVHLPLVVELNGGPVRAAQRRRRHDLRFRPADRACDQDAAARRGQHRRIGNRVEPRPQLRLDLPGRAAHAGDTGPGQTDDSFLSFGDRVRIEMFDAAGRSIFGAIDQRVVKAA